ncbi:MAG: cell division protein SepF [Filifactoraceae bacterium]
MAEKFTDKFREFLRGGDDEYEDDVYDDEDYEEEEVPISRASVSGERVVRMNHATPKVQKVVIYEPVNYDEDAPKIVDNIRDGKVCIVNLEKISDQDISKTIFDFLNGAIYAIDGNIKKVSKGIFILSDKNIDIDGNVKKELESKGFFRW